MFLVDYWSLSWKHRKQIHIYPVRHRDKLLYRNYIETVLESTCHGLATDARLMSLHVLVETVATRLLMLILVYLMGTLMGARISFGAMINQQT